MTFSAHRPNARALVDRKLLGLGLSIALVPASVWAQAQETLEEIVVTAQRREENIQDTPVAVSAFTAEALQASGVTNVRELSQVAPSLNIQHVAGVYLPFLRGIGNPAGGPQGNEASIGVYIDDVYYARLSAAYLALGSIDRVEVLNGPQGTLFGRNSSGGAIQMFSRDPGQEPELSAKVGYANYDTTSWQLYASTPISDNLAWNISVAGSDQREGWGRGITTGQDAYLENFWTARSKLVWEPTSSTAFKLVAFYAYSDGDIGLTQDRHSGSYGATPALPLPGYSDPPEVQPSLADVPGASLFDTRSSFRQFTRDEGYGASLRVDQDLGFAGLVSITAFRNSEGDSVNDSDFSPQNFFNTELNTFNDQITQEFQVRSHSGSAFDWIVGAFYFRSEAGNDPVIASGDLLDVLVAPGTVQNLFSRQVIDSYSLYAQTTFPVAERTNLTIGLRYTEDEVSGSGQQTFVIPGLGTVPAAADFEDSKKFGRLTWRAAIDHHFSDDVMTYASISRGFKAGTYNTTPLTDPPARAEVVDAYEIGLKSELFDRRLRLNGAVFWDDITDPQVITFLSAGATAAVGLTNAEEARVYGAEMTFEAVVTDGFALRGAATYLDGEFVEFTNAPFYSLDGTTLTGPVPGDASGNRMPGVSKWRFSAGANYSVDTRIGAWVADLSAAYTGRFAWNADNRVMEDAVTLVNASLAFTPAGADHLTFSVWGKNLGDEEYYTASQEFAGPLGIGGDIAAAAPPLTFGASVSLRF